MTARNVMSHRSGTDSNSRSATPIIPCRAVVRPVVRAVIQMMLISLSLTPALVQLLPPPQQHPSSHCINASNNNNKHTRSYRVDGRPWLVPCNKERWHVQGHRSCNNHIGRRIDAGPSQRAPISCRLHVVAAR